MKVRGLIVTLLATVALLAACGGSDDRDTTSPTAASPTATAPTATALACGAEITESVTLSADMDCDPVGLVVTGDNVVLDLGGHTISGPGPGKRSWPLPHFDVAGIVVRGDNVTVRNGIVRETGISVLVNDARGATITGVETAGSYYGVYLFHGGGHTVDGSVVHDNVYGLHLQESNGNRLLDNELSLQTHHSPGGYGLYLYGSNDNWFEGNTVRENLNWGLWFSNSTGNTIVRNNIIGNDPQVSDDSGGNVYFDATMREGNYWSDYTGVDDNSDGIGDLPYAIGGPGRSADPYPFVAQDGWQGRTTETLAQATPIPTPSLPPRGYIALDDGRIAAIDPMTGVLLGVWDGTVMSGSMATSPDGTRLYAIARDAEAANVVAYDTATGEIVERWEVAGALVIGAMYDGERVIVSTPGELVEIVLDTGEIRRGTDGANGVAITPSWKHNLVLVTDVQQYLNVVYLPDQHAPYRMALDGRPVQVVDNRAGTRLFALLENRSAVDIIDTEQFLVTDTVPLGEIEAGTARIAPSPDGSTLYILDTALSHLVAIDLATDAVIAEIAIGGEAIDLAVSGDGEHIMVATSVPGGGRLVVLDPELNPTQNVALPDAPVSLVSPR